MNVAEVLAPALSGGAMELIVRLSLNMLFTAAIVRGVYYRLYRDRDYTFTYFLINLVTFSIAYLLSHVPVEMGFALGLFAVFGILRYRTEAIQVRNLTYLFVVIGIALVNALANGGSPIVVLVPINVVLAGTVCGVGNGVLLSTRAVTAGLLRPPRSVRSEHHRRIDRRSARTDTLAGRARRDRQRGPAQGLRGPCDSLSFERFVSQIELERNRFERSWGTTDGTLVRIFPYGTTRSKSASPRERPQM